MITDACQSPFEEQARALIRLLCSHVVCLTGEAVPLDGRGAPCGPRRFFNYSGFVVSLYNRWLWVTAGHIIKDLNRQVRRGELGIVHSCFADYYGAAADASFPIPFDYGDEVRFWKDDDALGLDFGVIPIRPHYRRLMEKNGIQALEQDSWEELRSLKFDSYALLGFPQELFDERRRPSGTGGTIIGGVRPVLMFAKESDALPRTKPVPTHPWLALELRDKKEVKNLNGMSGGPIFGFRHREGKPPHYTAVGIQSWCAEQRRIAFGTRLPVVMEMIDQEITALREERTGTA
jgi:hypothetical protein